MKKIVLLSLSLLLLQSCNSKSSKIDKKEKYLQSWEEGKTKESIFKFIESITDENSSKYIAPKDRIATFDNDGTLWAEKPLPFQIYFVLDRIKEMSKTDESLKTTKPYKYAVNGDLQSLMKLGMEGVFELAIKAQSGITGEEFDTLVLDWINTAKHPKTGRLFKEMKYQPMMELMKYLEDNDFKIFIVSGGTRDFMRPFVPEIYGIPKSRVIGTRMKVVYNEETKKIDRLPELEFNNDKEGKPASIYSMIGKKPIIVVGNSDGDFQMMEYAEASGNPFLNILVNHNDAEREYNYNSNPEQEKHVVCLKTALKNKWIVVDIKNDWKVVYPYEMK